MAQDKKTEQGEVDEPQEDAVGAEEQPTERQREREEAIADEPVAESEQRMAEAAEPAPADSQAAQGPSDVDAEGEPAAAPAEPTADAPEVEVEGDEVVTEEDL